MTHAAPLCASALAVFAYPSLAQLQPGESVTVRLTHDDDDGNVLIGETVTWTLAIELIGLPELAVLSEVNVALDSTTPGLLGTSTFAFTPFNPNGSQDGWNGGEPIAISNPQGGFVQIALLNSVFLEAFGGGTADRRNPFVVGQFTATATGVGQGSFAITASGNEFGINNDLAPFSFDRAALDFGNPIGLDSVTLEIDTLTIVPAPATALPIAVVGLLATRRRNANPEQTDS